MARRDPARICEAEGCTNLIPAGSNRNRHYCGHLCTVQALRAGRKSGTVSVNVEEAQWINADPTKKYCAAPNCHNPIEAARTYCSPKCAATRYKVLRKQKRIGPGSPGYGIPPDLLEQMNDVRRNERVSYVELAKRFPGYSYGLIHREIKAHYSSRRMKLNCAWCHKIIYSITRRKQFCGPKCSQQAYAFNHNLKTEIRPPETMEARLCKQCGGPIPKGKRADTMYCERNCAHRARRARERHPRRRKPLHDDRVLPLDDRTARERGEDQDLEGLGGSLRPAVPPREPGQSLRSGTPESWGPRGDVEDRVLHRIS